jgi:predicted nucleotidyltransferase
MTAGGLSIKDRDCLRSVLAEFADKIDQVALFGSRATGLARANSDIDLVVYGRLTEGDVDRLWTLFDESSISVSVDIVAYDDRLYPPLRQHIDRTSKVLFNAQQLRGG